MEQTSENKRNELSTIAGIFIVLFSICVIFILASKSDENIVTKERMVKRVANVDVHRPVGVHEEINLMYDVTLDDGSVIKTRHHYQIGDTIVYFTYKKVNN
jgi:hypothetical protein